MDIFSRSSCFFVFDAMMRSVGRVELLYENPSRCIIFFYLARARTLHVAKETAVFSFFFSVRAVSLSLQSDTSSPRVQPIRHAHMDASAALHFWFNTHTLHIIIRTRQAVPEIINYFIIITIRRPREIVWRLHITHISETLSIYIELLLVFVGQGEFETNVGVPSPPPLNSYIMSIPIYYYMTCCFGIRNLQNVQSLVIGCTLVFYSPSITIIIIIMVIILLYH